MDKNFLTECLQQGMSTREIEKLCGKSCKTVSYWIHKHNLAEMQKYKKNENYIFEKIDTKEKAYALGFILGDGGICPLNTVEVAVALADRRVVEYIADIVMGNVHIDNQYCKEKRRFPRARMQKRIKDITKFVGARLKKERHFPIVRNDLERYLLLGFFDAEGCVTWGHREYSNGTKTRVWHSVKLTSAYKTLSGVQQYLLKKLNIATALRPKSNSDCFVLEFSLRSDVLKFCEHIYPDEKFIVLNRKYLKYKALRLELEENGEGRKCG